jgi:hypothetical protein
MAEGDDRLVLGPVMRYVDETSAGVWVETASAATVTVRAGGRSWEHRTFAVHDHHYALVEVEDLDPGSVLAYEVDVDGVRVWPPDGSPYPPPVIATLEPGKPLRMAWGSCRTSVPHDQAGNRTHGVDALRAMAVRMAAHDHDDERSWPDLVLFLGDQVYADETSDEMQEFIAARRDIDQPPGDELKDYEEYAHLYWLAWTDPAIRWLLSTLPSAMIFDDHDVRDDWNTSIAWKRKMDATRWWHQRLVAGLGSYWVYQHLGNLSHEERAEDELWRRIQQYDGPDELDLTAELDALAERADADPESYRWSYTRDVAGLRLVVLDSRAARVLDPERRGMLDEPELAWLDEHMVGGFRHLLVGTSLPFLLPPGLQSVEAWNEALVAGAWGRLAARVSEWLRQAIDLEHWGAFQRTFHQVARMAQEVADGERGPAPRTVTFLSGDVHHSYVSEVRRRGGSRVVQAVCSPIRNPLPRVLRFVTAIFAYPVAGFVGRLAARSAKVPDAPFRWRKVKGPWFDNCIATLEDGPDGLALTWETGVVDGDLDHPSLEVVGEALLRTR